MSLILDALQAWGPYAPVLLYLWMSLAYGTAYLRTRRRYVKGTPATPLFIALMGVLQPLVFATGVLRWENAPSFWWVNYLLLLLLPLILISPAHRPGSPSRMNGYRYPLDVLLFRSPAPDNEDVSTAHTAAPRAAQSRAVLWGTTAALGLIGALGFGLQVCGWLDIPLGRSGCLRSITVDRETIETVAFSPDGATLAAGGSDALVSLYDVADGRLLHILPGHQGWVTSVAFSPDGALLASASWDGIVRVWRTADYTLVHERRLVDRGMARLRLTFSPDGQAFATAGHDSLVQLWRTVDGSPLGAFPAEGFALAFSPDSRLLALAQPGGAIGLVERSTGTTVQTLAAHRYIVSYLAFAPDGQTLVSASEADEELKVWRLADGALLQTAPTLLRGSVALTRDGRRAAVGGMNLHDRGPRGQLTLIDLGSGAPLRSWPGHGSRVNAVAFSPDGTTLASGSSWQPSVLISTETG